MTTTKDGIKINIRRIVKDFLGLTLSNILSMTFKFFSSLIIAKILGPTNYGFWNVVELINRFSPLLTLGIASGVKREIPYWKAREDGFNHQAIADNGLSGMIISSILIIIAGILLSFSFSDSLTKFAILTVSSAGAFTQLYIFLVSLTLAHKMFTVTAKIKILESLLYLLITVTFAYYYNIYGMLVGSAVSPLIAIVIFFLITKYSISVKFDYIILKRIITVGMPIIAVGMFYMALISINRFVILYYLDLEHVGYWGFAMLLLTLFSQLTGAIGEILYTYMNEHLGIFDRVDNMDTISIYPAIINSLIMPIFIIIIMLILPYMVNIFFESYRQSIMTSQLILVSISLSYGGVNILGSYLKQKLLIIFLLISIGINATLSIYFLSSGLGIVWSAFALLCGLASYTICHTVASLVYMKKGRQYIIRLLSINIIYPGFVSGSVLFIYNSFDISPYTVTMMLLLPLIAPTLVILASLRKQVNPIRIVVSLFEN